MPLIRGLDNVNIRTADLAGTKTFFMDVVGGPKDKDRILRPGPRAGQHHRDAAERDVR